MGKSKKRKICVVTGTRAEYGLLSLLMKEIENDKDLTLQLIVTGMHLSQEFGLTYKEIENEFKIDKKIEILLSSDTSVGISKSMGLAQISFSEAFNELNPDMLVVLGDRFEIFSAVSAAMILRIPISHLYGGELTEGAVDDVIRHSITKMSHLHFTSTQQYKNRVIQLGENPKRVFNVGDTSIDNIKKLKLLSKVEFEKSINFKLNKKNILVTFHPETLDKEDSAKNMIELLNAIDKLKDTNIIFTKANADASGRIINNICEDYVKRNHNKAVLFNSLGQIRYLSALKFVDVVVGNSSSGITEAPMFNIGTINIGNRQKGRIQAKSIINCKPKSKDILNVFNILYSSNFQKRLKNIKNLYGDGDASIKIKNVIKNYNIDNIIIKSFYDFENSD